MPRISDSSATAELAMSRAADASLVVRLAGPWRLTRTQPSPTIVEREIATKRPARVVFDAAGLTSWDSAILTFLRRVSDVCREHGIAADRAGLPEGVRRLLDLADAVPDRAGARDQDEDTPLLARVGEGALSFRDRVTDGLAFVGESTTALGRMAVRRARYRMRDLMLLIQQAGAEALPIVTLISLLVGLIFAFVGAVQLQRFGATIYVADLVGISMVRDMGAMMTAIVMAGRTGASYAAQLATMKVTQELDALTTMGISPMEFLVLPRMIALFLMMPLLCLYADLLGILGGAVVGIGMLDLSPGTYFRQTAEAVRLVDLLGGLCKASVYGVLIALAGCLRGMQSGNSSAAVGEATTSAVVTSIVAIVGACGIFAVLFYIMGI